LEDEVFKATLFQQSRQFCPLSGRGAPLNRGYARGAGILAKGFSNNNFNARENPK